MKCNVLFVMILFAAIMFGLTGCGSGGGGTNPGSYHVPTSTSTSTGTNVAPVANAGRNKSVSLNTFVTLDGSASSDENSDLLKYTWSLSSKPTGSSAVLSSAIVAKPTFTADVAGAYVFSLVVNDGKVNSTPATVTINASSVGSLSGATVTLRVADVLDLAKNHNGLSNLPIIGIKLRIGDTVYLLPTEFASFVTYNDLVDSIKNGLSNIDYGYSITVVKNSAIDAVLPITVTDSGITYFQGTVAGKYFPIVLTNYGPDSLSIDGFVLAPGSMPGGNLILTTVTTPPK